ncbi:MAG TPA: amidase [Gemmatimonadales bacterium]|jgi:aspartyl-tRNA(Asn)/glutamyl-tRNA(Gln) amidotransferase subunit A|nr:amidase [Gemmatimonadales bacterium]
MSDPAFLTVPALGRLLRLRRLSCVELATACLDRLERIGPRYSAVAELLRESALADARERDVELLRGKDRGPLHGIPYGVKHLVATDATVVSRLRRHGAVLCATLAMADLASDRPGAAGPPSGRSPWDPSRWSGGSSSGSAAAVAAGLLPFTLGSETWGSIQYPAAFCGVTGLRPTFGLVSRHGARTLSRTMDKLGPLAQTAEDCGVVLAATAGADPNDPSALTRGFQAPATPTIRRYRLGILRGTIDGTQPEVRQNFESTLAALADVADLVDDLILPDYPYDAMAGAVLAAEFADSRESWSPLPAAAGTVEPGAALGARARRGGLARDYMRALRLRRPAAAALDRLLAQVDAVLAPTLPTVAWPVGVPSDQAYPEYPGGTSIAGAANLCGAPALFLPNGFGEAGLPTSLQLTGRARSEATLLQLGMHFQARTDFHRRRPPGL